MSEEKTGGETTPFRALASRASLLNLLEAARAEVAQFGQDPSGEYHFPTLAVLWASVAPYTEDGRKDPGSPANQFWSAWATAGNGPERMWHMGWPEAIDRLALIQRFLVQTGPLALGAGEVDVPRNYLTREERGVLA